MTDLALTLPPELVEEIAARAAAIVLEQLERDQSRDEGPWLTLPQAGERLGCSPDAVRMRVKRGRLEYKRQGRRLYVSRASVDALS